MMPHGAMLVQNIIAGEIGVVLRTLVSNKAARLGSMEAFPPKRGTDAFDFPMMTRI